MGCEILPDWFIVTTCTAPFSVAQLGNDAASPIQGLIPVLAEVLALIAAVLPQPPQGPQQPQYPGRLTLMFVEPWRLSQGGNAVCGERNVPLPRALVVVLSLDHRQFNP